MKKEQIEKIIFFLKNLETMLEHEKNSTQPDKENIELVINATFYRIQEIIEKNGATE